MNKRCVKIMDLMQISFILDPPISHDGRCVVFVHTTINYKKDDYISDLWMADLETKKISQFTSGRGKDRNPGGSKTTCNIFILF